MSVVTPGSIHRRQIGAQAFALLAFVFAASLIASEAKARPPRLILRAFEIHTQGSSAHPGVHRRIQLAAPEGWTPAERARAPELELIGPNGEGRMLVFAGLHPSHLGPVLARLRRAHPSAQPSPPEKLDLPGIRPDLGERATRFVITGREVGEMVLIERNETIVLLVTVVDPNAWAALEPILARVYPTVSVTDVRAPEDGAKKR